MKHNTRYPEFVMEVLRQIWRGTDTSDEAIQGVEPEYAASIIWSRVDREKISNDVAKWFDEKYGILIKSEKSIKIILRSYSTKYGFDRTAHFDTVFAPFVKNCGKLVAFDEYRDTYNIYYIILSERYANWVEYRPYINIDGYRTAKIVSMSVVEKGKTDSRFKEILEAKERIENAKSRIRNATFVYQKAKERYRKALLCNE